MCGIAGFFASPAPLRGAERMLQRMCDAIWHRGPDDEGIHVEGPVGLGHRRLSIIDLAGGHQPMANEDGTLWISYNGEVYNYRELRRELEPRHRFATRSDTEVILHLYEEEGLDALKRLNGIFAFALYDRTHRRLVLARDRFGIKPLYYATGADGTLLFASEIKALLATGRVQAEVDEAALAEHFTFQNNFGERTLFRGVRLLEPGTALVAEPGRMTRRQYWDLRYAQEPARSEDDYVEALRDRFQQAVRRQLVSDVPVGAYLSGGMDSGSISAVAAREIRPFHTFTCGFDTAGVSEMEQNFDERVEAELLARMLDTQHHERHIYPGDMIGILPHLVWHLEDFRAGISYQVYAISQLISDYVTVVLSGVGGDELFAGYPWRYEKILGLPPGPAFDRTYYGIWARLLNDTEKRKLFSPEVNRALGGFSSYGLFQEAIAKAPCDHPLHRALYFDAKTFLHGLFVVEDKLSMAHAIETRVPFLDNELVDLVLKMPPEMKFQQGQIKYILKKAMKGLLPEDTLWRRKQGFTPPDQTWYKGETLTYIRSLILSERAVARGFFNPAYLEQILSEHVDGRRNHRFLIWSLMCFEWWQRLFVDGDPLPERPTADQPAEWLTESVLA